MTVGRWAAHQSNTAGCLGERAVSRISGPRRGGGAGAQGAPEVAHFQGGRALRARGAHGSRADRNGGKELDGAGPQVRKFLPFHHARA